MYKFKLLIRLRVGYLVNALQFQVESFRKTAMWPRLEALCEFVSNHTGWYPYDVALNYVRSGDHTRIHPDSEHHQVILVENLESQRNDILPIFIME